MYVRMTGAFSGRLQRIQIFLFPNFCITSYTASIILYNISFFFPYNCLK